VCRHVFWMSQDVCSLDELVCLESGLDELVCLESGLDELYVWKVV